MAVALAFLLRLSFGLPIFFPFAMAALRPAWVRSTMRSRSNSARLTKMCIINFPETLDVSMLSLTFASLYLLDMCVLINGYKMKFLHDKSPILPIKHSSSSPIFLVKLLQTIQGHTFLFSDKHLRTANSSASLSLSNFDMNSIL